MSGKKSVMIEENEKVTRPLTASGSSTSSASGATSKTLESSTIVTLSSPESGEEVYLQSSVQLLFDVHAQDAKEGATVKLKGSRIRAREDSIGSLWGRAFEGMVVPHSAQSAPSTHIYRIPASLHKAPSKRPPDTSSGEESKATADEDGKLEEMMRGIKEFLFFGVGVCNISARVLLNPDPVVGMYDIPGSWFRMRREVGFFFFLFFSLSLFFLLPNSVSKANNSFFLFYSIAWNS
jgi:hypothetical protein